MKDEEIIDLFFARSQRGIEELEAKYGRLFCRLAGNILANSQDAEECVNDAYFGVWNRIPPKRPDRLCAYACKIVRNLALKRHERNTAAKRNSQYDAAFEELEGCLSSENDPQQICEGRELTRLIEVFLDSLQQKDRILFIRRYWFADSVTEISRRMDMTPGAVSVRLARTRNKLKGYLERNGY